MSKPIAKMTAKEKERLQRQLDELIKSAVIRVHYAEGRKTTFLGIGAALFAGGVALITTAVARTDGNSLWYSAVAAGISLASLGVSIWLVYSRQTNRYPWTSATRTWKWFYRDALPSESAFNFSIWHYFIGWDKLGMKARSAFTQQLSEFKKGQILDLIDPDTSIEQDIQQLYVLHVNDKYKNLHLSHLQTILHRGIILAIILSAVVAASILLNRLLGPVLP